MADCLVYLLSIWTIYKIVIDSVPEVEKGGKFELEW